MPKREHSPLTDEQKDLLRSKFVKLCPLKNACTYCSKIVSSDHIARWASHFRACKKVNEADKRAYYALGNDPMPACKRKAFKTPIPQQHGDMIGIELVLHASLLQTMQDDTGKASKKKRKQVSSKLEAQDRAEKLVENNFNVPESLSDAATIDEVDREFAEALSKAKSYILAAEEQKSIDAAATAATTTAATHELDSIATERDDDLEMVQVETKSTTVHVEGIGDVDVISERDSPQSDPRTDVEDMISSSFGSYAKGENPVVDPTSLQKAPLVPCADD